VDTFHLEGAPFSLIMYPVSTKCHAGRVAAAIAAPVIPPAQQAIHPPVAVALPNPPPQQVIHHNRANPINLAIPQDVVAAEGQPLDGNNLRQLILIDKRR
jgi:hypothetical protein